MSELTDAKIIKMFKFATLLKRFIPPYKKYVFLSLLFNLLTMVFSIFSYTAIMPILELLFGIEKVQGKYMPWTFDDSSQHIIDAVKNNLYLTLGDTLQSLGPSLALVYLGIFLVIMTALKVGTAYLGSYYLIPIRTGVLRDLRNQLYNKIINLPIGFFTEERKGDLMSRMTGEGAEVDASIMSS